MWLARQKFVRPWEFGSGPDGVNALKQGRNLDSQRLGDTDVLGDPRVDLAALHPSDLRNGHACGMGEVFLGEVAACPLGAKVGSDHRKQVLVGHSSSVASACEGSQRE